MTTDPCGCPPTASVTGTNGALHHLIVNVKDVPTARAFYDWLMPRLGYPGVTDYGAMVGYFGDGGSFWLKQAAPTFASDTFDKDRVGLCEIAFRADSRRQVDDLARDLAARGARILDPPKEYAYTPGYYATFFADPDGLKLELVHIPG